MAEYAYKLVAQAWRTVTRPATPERETPIEVVATDDESAVQEALRVLGPLTNPWWEWKLQVINRVDMRIVAARGKETEND